MKYLIAIFFPFIPFFSIRKPMSGYVCLILHILAFLGLSLYPNVYVLFVLWFMLILWSFFEISDYNSEVYMGYALKYTSLTPDKRKTANLSLPKDTIKNIFFDDELENDSVKTLSINALDIYDDNDDESMLMRKEKKLKGKRKTKKVKEDSVLKMLFAKSEQDLEDISIRDKYDRDDRNDREYNNTPVTPQYIAVPPPVFPHFSKNDYLKNNVQEDRNQFSLNNNRRIANNPDQQRNLRQENAGNSQNDEDFYNYPNNNFNPQRQQRNLWQDNEGNSQERGFPSSSRLQNRSLGASQNNGFKARNKYN